jgi:hypothetical protein
MHKINIKLVLTGLTLVCSQGILYGQTPGAAGKLDRLAQAITVNCTTVSQKVDSIVYWVCKNISYDYASYQTFYEGRAMPLTIDSVLSNRKAVCDGYALLTQELLQRCGLEAVRIRGYGKYAGTDLLEDTSMLAHEWNAVKINGRWQLLDVTWTDIFLNAEDSSLFFCRAGADKFIWSHYPFDVKWSLLKHPPTMQEFLDRPIIFWHAIAATGVRVPDVEGTVEKNIITSEDFIFIENKFSKKYDVRLDLEDENEESLSNAEINYMDRPRPGYRISLPKPGVYLLNIGIRLPAGETSLETYPIIAAKVIRTK